jgi:hypothetical protein
MATQLNMPFMPIWPGNVEHLLIDCTFSKQVVQLVWNWSGECRYKMRASKALRHDLIHNEVFYGTQYDPTVVLSVSFVVSL